MKEGSHTIEIIPLSGYLDFTGPASEHASTENSQILKGNVVMKLNKAIKVKTITVKFKGYSQVQQYMKNTDTQPQHSISIPLLPKLKTKVLSKSIILPVGDHVLPWELEIPNIYPRTFSASKRGSIQYQVELKISLGLNKKDIIADHPIVIRRHLISPQEQTTNIRTNTYENISNKFRYEIEAPSIISIAQPHVPLSIKFNRPCMFIYTQIIQTEIYRCRNISKAEADMAIMASKKNSTMIGGQIYESFKNGDAGLSKFFKRIQPVTLNTIDPEADVLPLLILHSLKDDSLLTPGIESPLISIYHQLEVTFNFGGGQQHDEIRAKIPILVSSVPDSAMKLKTQNSVSSNTPTGIEKYLMEKQLHRVPALVEVIDTTISLDKKLSKHITLDERTTEAMKNSLQVMDEDRSIKKSISDQNMQQTVAKRIEEEKRRSVTPPPPFTKPNMINTQLANTLESSLSLVSPYTPNRPTLISSNSSQSADLVLQPPIESFTGLPPPPRRARKKEPPTTVSGDDYNNRMVHSSSPPLLNNRNTLPLPPLPTSSNNSVNSGNSRPTSPMSINLPTGGSVNGNYHQFKHSSSSDFISTPPQSPLPPSTPRTLLRLNQSRSSCTTSSLDSQLSRKRSNSTNNDNYLVDDYSKSITSHYCSADLPPIPPAITRQKLPSIPSVDKEEHRKTRMYYEDESDDEEDDDEDYTFFLQQTFK